MWVFKDFVGENNVDAPSEIQDNELAEAVNFYVNNVRHLVPREGFTKILSVSSDVLGLCYHDGVLYYALADGKVYKYSNNTSTQIGTHANLGAVRLLPALGKIFVVDGAELKYYDGTNYVMVNTLLWHEQVIGTGNGQNTTFSGTLSRLPITPLYVTVIAGSVSATDNGQGSISGTGVNGTVNYTTGAISVTFSTPPANGVAVKVKYTTSDVVDVRASLIAFKQDKLYCAYGDRVYYMRTPRDLSAWDFVGIDTQAGGNITALHVFYTDLVVGKGRKIYRLSFDDEVPTVSLLASNLSMTQDASVAVKGDIVFVCDGRVHTLKSTMEWGDIKVYSLNPKFRIGDIYRLIPSRDFIIGYGMPKSFIFTPAVEAFTTFASPLEFKSHFFDGVDLYVGTNNTILKYGGNTDDTATVSRVVKFKEINAWNKRAVVKQVILSANQSIYSGGLTLMVRKGRQKTTHVISTLAFTDIALWGSAQWNDANWAVDTSFKARARQNLTDYSLQFILSTTGLDSVHSLYVEGGLVNG